tara:strand:- start:218 stop:2086 length:1869 start_codon:yes stop_codon:yes gene_type:complete
MKILFNIVRWILGLFLILGSFGGIMSGDVFWGLITLAIGLILLPPIGKKLFSKKNEEKLSEKLTTKDIISTSSKSVSKNKTELTIDLNQEELIKLYNQNKEERANELKNFNYIPEQIQRKGIQLLESLNILNTTKNIDTLKNRFDFISKMYDDFIKSSYKKRYISDIQIAVDEYKTLYYDKIINDFELQLLVRPQNENLIDYYSECLYNCFNKFINEQESQIKNLKKEDAKKRRNEKIVSVANETISEFDKNGSNKEKYKEFIKIIQNKRDSLSENQSFTKKLECQLKIENDFVINPKDSFLLTLHNSPKNILQNVLNILKNDEIWNKSKELLPLFAEHNIKCKEVEEYILKYKPIYLEKLQELKIKSEEYQNSSEMDKQDIEIEFKEKIVNELSEKADCSIQTLFDFSNIDITIDDQLIKKYGFDTISKYFGISNYKNKIISNWERKEFEDLIEADLVFTSKEIEIEEILKYQTLKILNKISEKEEGHFKRKNKAIEFIQENKNLLKNVGKYISTRKIFKLKPLPIEFQHINLNKISDHWKFIEEYTKLISDTYRMSKQNAELRSEDNSWIEGFRVDKFEDLNSNFICQRARKECQKNYSKSNPPKMPFHIGCNCELRQEF